VLDEVGESVVEVAGGLFEDADDDFDSGVAKSLDAPAADLGVGVLRGDDATGDSGGDESVGTGWGAAVVAAGFEGHVGCGSLGGVTLCGGLFEGDDFGVVAVVVEMGTFADDFGISLGGCADEDAAYLGVRRGEADRLGGEREGPLHEEFVVRGWCVFRHAFKDTGFRVYEAAAAIL
jgi:hypothetical protein